MNTHMEKMILLEHSFYFCARTYPERLPSVVMQMCREVDSAISDGDSEEVVGKLFEHYKQFYRMVSENVRNQRSLCGEHEKDKEKFH